MRTLNKLLGTMVISLLSFGLFSFNPSHTFAAVCHEEVVFNHNIIKNYIETSNISFFVEANDKTNSWQRLQSGQEYTLTVANTFSTVKIDLKAIANNGKVSFAVDNTNYPSVFKKGKWFVSFDGPGISGGSCLINRSNFLDHSYEISSIRFDYLRIYQMRDTNNDGTPDTKCFYHKSDGCIDKITPVTMESRFTDFNGNPLTEKIRVDHIFESAAFIISKRDIPTDGLTITNHQYSIGYGAPAGNYKVQVVLRPALFSSQVAYSTTLNVADACTKPETSCLQTDPELAKYSPMNIASADSSPYKICDQIPETLSDQKQKCLQCIGGEGGYSGIWTAIGCIPNNPETIVKVFLRFGLGMGGGVALLMILGAGFMLTVSQGDPKQTDTAKQWLTSAIAGLLFIIFSVTILQFIGYNVFQIPGFGG